MGNKEPRVRPHSRNEGYFGTPEGCERWRSWARGHDRSAEYDGSSTVVQRSWYGRLTAPAPAR